MASEGELVLVESRGGRVVTADLMHYEPGMTEEERAGKFPVGKPPSTY